MTSKRSDLSEALERFRSKLRNHPVRASVVGTGTGFDPNGDNPPEGFVVLYDKTATPAVLQTIRDLARETAPHIALYLLPSAPPRLLVGGDTNPGETA
jgi:hypothetical protein